MNQTDPQIVRIRLEGALDISARDRLATLLQPAHAADVVILDLTDATYLDASALGCLISLKNQLLARGGGAVHLVGVPANIRKTFSVTGLDKHFKFADRFSPLPHF